MMFDCEDVAVRLSDDIDGELGGWERLKVRMHLAMCRRCSKMERSLRRTVELLKGMPEEGPNQSPEPDP